jgi:hypothetical protein
MDIEERRTGAGGLVGVAVGIDAIRGVVSLARLSLRDETASTKNEVVQRQ